MSANHQNLLYSPVYMMSTVESEEIDIFFNDFEIKVVTIIIIFVPNQIQMAELIYLYLIEKIFSLIII